MGLNAKINAVKDLARTAPVLVLGVSAEMFGTSTVLEADIASKELGIVNTPRGLKTPRWFYELVNGNGSHQIIINNLDAIDQENQAKFYELLKYKTISTIELPADCRLIVIAHDLKKVAAKIMRLCLLVE